MVTHQASDNSSHVKDGPEDSKEFAFGALLGIGDHDGALSRPEQTSTDSEKCAGEDVETTNMRMFGGEQTDGIDAVSDTAKGESNLDTQFIDNGATEEAKNGEGGIESCVLQNVTCQLAVTREEYPLI